MASEMEHSIEIEGIKTNYKKSGKGKTIILLHGWGCDLHIFDNLHNLLEQHFTVYSVDLPGFGKTDQPQTAWTIEDYSGFVGKFIELNDIDSPILLGHSFGGRISIILGARIQLNKIVLIGSAGVKPTRGIDYYLKVYTFKAGKHIIRLISRNDELLNKWRKTFGSSDYQNTSGIMQKVFVNVVNQDLKNFMHKINVPTLLIWGENDTATPIKDARIMEKLIPNSGLVILKNCGHYCFLEKSYEFNIIINNFLNKDQTNG
jgi:pimeloyl-ACP methyl ester carboxylesterase